MVTCGNLVNGFPRACQFEMNMCHCITEIMCGWKFLRHQDDACTIGMAVSRGNLVNGFPRAGYCGIIMRHLKMQRSARGGTAGSGERGQRLERAAGRAGSG